MAATTEGGSFVQNTGLPEVEEETGGFNGNFERWFAKEEKRPKIKLEVFDPTF